MLVDYLDGQWCCCGEDYVCGLAHLICQVTSVRNDLVATVVIGLTCSGDSCKNNQEHNRRHIGRVDRCYAWYCRFRLSSMADGIKKSEVWKSTKNCIASFEQSHTDIGTHPKLKGDFSRNCCIQAATRSFTFQNFMIIISELEACS